MRGEGRGGSGGSSLADVTGHVARHGEIQRLRLRGLNRGHWALNLFAWIECQEIETHQHLEAWCALLALKRRHALLEQLAVEIEADGGDMPALLGAQQVTRAA